MKTALFLSALVALTFTARPSVAQSVKNAGKTIVCEEFGFDEETGEDKPLAKITIHLGANGKADRMDVVRPKTNEFEAVRKTFTLANAKIKHAIEKNDTEINEETGEQILDPVTKKPQYKWNIEDVEVINGKDASGLSVTALINDHLYAGRPGSVVAISKGDKIVISSGQGMVGCTGAVMFPHTPASE
jgi:hypothetical protein